MISWEYKSGSENGPDKEGRYHAIASSNGIMVGYIRREKFCNGFMFMSVILPNTQYTGKLSDIDLFDDIPRARKYIEKLIK